MRGPALLAGILMAATLTAGCFVGSVEQVQTLSQTFDADNDGDPGWIQIRMIQAPNPAPTFDQVDVRVNGPDGSVTTKQCRAPDLNATRCADPIEPGEPWNAGDSLFIPCPRPGENAVHVGFPGGMVLNENKGCGESPFDQA